MRNRLQQVSQLAGAVVNFVFPPTCANCNNVGALLCATCRSEIVLLCGPVCEQCGRPLSTNGSTPRSLCPACLRDPLNIRVRAATLYREPVTRLIHKLKYNQQFALAEPLADLMMEAWPAWPERITAVVPIPLHAKREKERGFNQAAVIAEALARRLDLPVESRALRRTRYTAPQVSLDARERQTNMQDAFACETNALLGAHVLLIDDVCTTGATLSAAADALRQAGVASVVGYCVARAV